MNSLWAYFGGLSPYPEWFFRRIYYGFLKDYGIKRPRTKIGRGSRHSVCPDAVLSCIKHLGISKGDILIVHSSMDILSSIGITPLELIAELERLVGPEGTLAFPAYPQYKQKSNQKSVVGQLEIFEYNTQRTLCSTGILPNIFIRMPGVIRSSFPENSMAARGHHAEAMMKDNLAHDLPHGRGSSWNYCAEHHAKIIFLGVKASNTTTMVHVAEDMLDEDWPIAHWYESHTYAINTRNERVLFTARRRRQFWSRFNVSLYRSHLFVQQGLLAEKKIDGINIGFVPDSKKLVEYIISRARKGKLFFLVPRRYWKKQ